MKRILLCDRRPNLLETIEVLLRHWGYRVLVAHRPEQIGELLAGLKIDLAMIADEFFAEAALRQTLAEQTGIAVITIGDGTLDNGCDHLPLPLDIFSLFALIQKHLERIPRRHLRLPVSVPALLDQNGKEQLCEIISISRHGLFVKSTLIMHTGERLRLTLPLIGLKRELDLAGEVLYVIRPTIENNYLNGFGLEFCDPTDEALQTLERFIERRLLADLADYGHSLTSPTEQPSEASLPILKLLTQ